MISSFYLSGRLMEHLSETVRIVEVEHFTSNHDDVKVDRFPITSWSKNHNARLMTLKEGMLVIVKGRLETSPEFGPILVEEVIEFLGKGNLEISK